MDFFDDEKFRLIYKLLVLILLGIIIFLIILFNFKKTNCKAEIVEKENNVVAEVAQETEDSDENTSIIYVDIKGMVNKPGVYQVNDGAIVNDVIKLAGGLKKGGSTKYLNLSKRVQNEMVIYIYSSTELKKLTSIVSDCFSNDENIQSCVEEKASIIVSKSDSSLSTDKTNNNDGEKEKQSGENSLININKANIQELTTLSGIGESKAQAIIKYREENGNFQKIEDIMNVSGIGEAAYQKIKDSITV